MYLNTSNLFQIFSIHISRTCHLASGKKEKKKSSSFEEVIYQYNYNKFFTLHRMQIILAKVFKINNTLNF